MEVEDVNEDVNLGWGGVEGCEFMGGGGGRGLGCP